MKNRFVIFVVLISSFSFFSCKREDGLVRLVFETTVDGSSWDIATPFEVPEQGKVDLDIFKFYVSNITLVNEEGEETMMADSYLMELEEGLNTIEMLIPDGTYTSLKFGIGVPSDKNLENPANYDADHSLSIRQGMHWSWSVGYIFSKIEGSWDSTGTGTFTKDLLYHVGTEGLYREVNFTTQDIIVSETEPVDIVLEVDLKKVLDAEGNSLNLSEENFTHSTPEGSSRFDLAKKVADNLSGPAMSKKPF
ncbi:MAG: MbnP family protein [Bacteroidota bacterium]